MTFRYSKLWAETDSLGSILTKTLGCVRVAPRVGGLYPGVTSPIPSNLYPVDLVTVCEETAKHLVSKYKLLYVPWTGSINTTLVACLLAKYKTPTTKLILGTFPTHDETDESWLKLMEMGCLSEPVCDVRMRDMVGYGGMVVTSYPADSLLLGMFAESCNIDDMRNMSPPELISTHLGVDDYYANWILGRLSPLIDELPFDKTTLNIAWWLDFAAAWDIDCYDSMFRYNIDRPGVGYYNFFESDDMQRWAMQPTHLKIGGTDIEYKYRYQEIIYSILGTTPTKNGEVDIDDRFPLVDIFTNRLIAINEDYTTVRSSF